MSAGDDRLRLLRVLTNDLRAIDSEGKRWDLTRGIVDRARAMQDLITLMTRPEPGLPEICDVAMQEIDGVAVLHDAIMYLERQAPKLLQVTPMSTFMNRAQMELPDLRTVRWPHVRPQSRERLANAGYLTIRDFQNAQWQVLIDAEGVGAGERAAILTFATQNDVTFLEGSPSEFREGERSVRITDLRYLKDVIDGLHHQGLLFGFTDDNALTLEGVYQVVGDRSPVFMRELVSNVRLAAGTRQPEYWER